MGITVSTLEHFLELKRRYKSFFSGSVLQLGRQDTFISTDTFLQTFDKWGMSIPSNFEIDVRSNPWLNGQNTVSDDSFFKALGFNEINSMDFVNNENPNIIFDLNQELPNELARRFDFIYNGGTLEHVFDICQGFRNIHSMLKPGGVIVHECPTHNFVDHGFWQISPTAILDAYSVNQYSELLTIILLTNRQSMHYGPYERFGYDSSQFEPISVGGHGSYMMVTFSSFQKPLENKKWKIPTQGFYNKYFNLKVK
jgi:SAM-dependent methyltransferase